ncbi:MAG: AAA family ATPase [Planctomycetes bacterium]|nr:AAA family ATPase [Planctomycetota bacterium]
MGQNNSSGFLDFWGLKLKPFENTSDFRFFHYTKPHREAMARLNYVVEDKNCNFAMLSGEIGSGKTMIISKLLSQLHRDEFAVAYMENSHLSFTYLLRFILIKIGVKASQLKLSDQDYYMAVFQANLEENIIKRNRHLVIILDEAQDLENDCLVKVKNLTNIHARHGSHTSIILVGQPELRDLIRTLPQLDQRISVRFHLRAIDEDNLAGYLAHRLKVAGFSGQGILKKEIIPIICEATGGIPREINRLMKISMELGYTLEKKVLDREIVQKVIGDLRVQRQGMDSEPVISSSNA